MKIGRKRRQILEKNGNFFLIGIFHAAQCSKIRKKVHFLKYKNTLFTFSKMAKNGLKTKIPKGFGQ